MLTPSAKILVFSSFVSFSESYYEAIIRPLVLYGREALTLNNVRLFTAWKRNVSRRTLVVGGSLKI